MFDYSLDWGKSEAQIILEIIKEVGVHRLSGFDGCLCGGFEIRRVKFDLACGKGRDRGLWISSRSVDYPEDEHVMECIMSEVGAEAQRQFYELNDGRGILHIHYRKWSRSK